MNYKYFYKSVLDFFVNAGWKHSVKKKLKKWPVSPQLDMGKRRNVMQQETSVTFCDFSYFLSVTYFDKGIRYKY